MPFKFVNRAKMTTATTGTGTVTLGAAVSAFQTFAAAGIANGDTCRYLIEDGVNFEIGTGTYNSTGPTLARSVESSSNSNALVSLSGNATVSVIAAAADLGVPASQAEMEAGTEAALRSMSPLRVAQAIAALGGGGLAWTSAGTATTASGSSATVTGIPSTARELLLIFNGVSPTFGIAFEVRLGDSGGVETTGYLGASSTGFITIGTNLTGGSQYYGCVYMTSDDGITWYATGHLSGNSTNNSISGNKTLSATLDRVNVVPTSGAFDAGNIEVFYR